jgi:hypothetical protein
MIQREQAFIDFVRTDAQDQLGESCDGKKGPALSLDFQ